MTRNVDEIIQQAIREGAFDNLPGKGKPLELDENPYLDPEWQLAYHLLQQNGFAPDFIERRQEIEQDLAAARQALARSWAWRQQALAEDRDAAFVEAEWGRAQRVFEEAVEKLNVRIRDYNLISPSAFSRRSLIRFEWDWYLEKGTDDDG